VRVNAYPDKLFRGKVAFVYPTVTAETRTARVRIELPNPGRLLKPDMYASVELAIRQRGDLPGQGQKRLTVSDSAVLDSGARQIVLVQRGEGLYEPREVKLGQRGEGVVEVLEGVKEGETVVVSANFLIDAESNLKAAVGGFGQSVAGAGLKPPAAKAHAAEGRVVSAYPKTGSAIITHGPVQSLEWGGMTMEFKVADPALFAAIKAGAAIRFEFIEQPPGEWTVVRATPIASSKSSAPAPGIAPAPEASRETGASPANPHQGH
jgi:Cu(I)/Ag(I) efflux system membrane fusion protein